MRRARAPGCPAGWVRVSPIRSAAQIRRVSASQSWEKSLQSGRALTPAAALRYLGVSVRFFPLSPPPSLHPHRFFSFFLFFGWMEPLAAGSGWKLKSCWMAGFDPLPSPRTVTFYFYLFLRARLLQPHHAPNNQRVEYNGLPWLPSVRPSVCLSV